MERGILKIVLPKIAGITIFLVCLGFLNILNRYISWNFFTFTTLFLNNISIQLIAIVVIFMFAEILSGTDFPSNIFSPILSFTGTVFILNLVFKITETIESSFGFTFLKKIIFIKQPIYLAILSLVLIFGYLPIIYRILKEQKNKEPQEKENSSKPIIVIKEKIKNKPKRKRKNEQRK